MNTETEPIPAETVAKSKPRRRSVHWWRSPIVLPLAASVVAIGGVGALGYVALSPATNGWFAVQGVPIADRDGLVAVAGLGLVLVCVGSIAAALRLRVLLQIRASLLAFAKGERCEGALGVADLPGAGTAWNELLDWRQAALENEEARALLSASGDCEQINMHAADALWHGVIVIDEQQIIRYANGASAVFLRQRRDALLGVDVRRVVTDEAVIDAIQNAVETGSRQKRVMDVGDAETSDASVLRYSVRANGSTSDRSILIVIEDVTQQRISDAAQHAFVAQAAHELRTPLTNMNLYLEQLIEDELTIEERGTALNVINGEIVRLDKIVGAMLSIAEIQSGSMHAQVGEVRMQPIFEQIEADHGETARQKKLTLTLELPPKLPALQGDRDKISIVLHNLVGNAIKYTPEGGTVRVVVREEGDRFVTEVIDTGIGIGENDISRVFDRFARADDPRVAKETGTGLGLALARDIARMHNGDITVHSELDSGSTFSFWMPIASSTTAQAA